MLTTGKNHCAMRPNLAGRSLRAPIFWSVRIPPRFWSPPFYSSGPDERRLVNSGLSSLGSALRIIFSRGECCCLKGDLPDFHCLGAGICPSQVLGVSWKTARISNKRERVEFSLLGFRVWVDNGLIFRIPWGIVPNPGLGARCSLS